MHFSISSQIAFLRILGAFGLYMNWSGFKISVDDSLSAIISSGTVLPPLLKKALTTVFSLKVSEYRVRLNSRVFEAIRFMVSFSVITTCLGLYPTFPFSLFCKAKGCFCLSDCSSFISSIPWLIE